MEKYINLINDLNIEFSNIIGFNPCIEIFSKRKEYTTYYFKNNRDINSKYDIEFTFRIWKKGEYISIDDFYIIPVNTGMGKKIIEKFIFEINNKLKINVFLNNTKESKEFWEKRGFLENRIRNNGYNLVCKIK